MTNATTKATLNLGQQRIDCLELHVQDRLRGRIREFSVRSCDAGLVLHGQCHTYHTKQLAQHEVMHATDVPILANEIEVI